MHEYFVDHPSDDLYIATNGVTIKFAFFTARLCTAHRTCQPFFNTETATQESEESNMKANKSPEQISAKSASKSSVSFWSFPPRNFGPHQRRGKTISDP